MKKSSIETFLRIYQDLKKYFLIYKLDKHEKSKILIQQLMIFEWK